MSTHPSNDSFSIDIWNLSIFQESDSEVGQCKKSEFTVQNWTDDNVTDRGIYKKNPPYGK